MGIDTAVLDTSMAVTPELAWSLAGDDAVLDFPADPLDVDEDAQVLVERYSWWLVWRRAALLVVVAAALAVGIVVGTHGWHASVPIAAAAAQSSTPDSDPFVKEAESPEIQDHPSHDPDVCAYIRAGRTVQQTVDVTMQNSSLTLEQARAYVDAGIRAYCPEMSASAAHH